MDHSRIAYDAEARLPSGSTLQCSTTYVWPDAGTIEEQGGQIAASRPDGTPLIVFWPSRGQVSFNSEAMTREELDAAIAALEDTVAEFRKTQRPAKGFGRK